MTALVHLHTGPDGALLLLFTLSTVFNLAIVAGYFAIPFTTLPQLVPWSSPCPNDQRFYRFVRVSGVLFFATCGIHHVSSALSRDHAVSVGLVVNDGIQAVAVWCFLLGFATIVRRVARRRARGLGCPEVDR